MEHIQPPYVNNKHRLSHERNTRDAAENVHHILARAKGWTNDKDNRIKLFHYIHSAIHTLFGNNDLVGKIEKLYHIEDTALEEEIKIDIEQLIKKRKGKDIYKAICNKHV